MTDPDIDNLNIDNFSIDTRLLKILYTFPEKSINSFVHKNPAYYFLKLLFQNTNINSDDNLDSITDIIDQIIANKNSNIDFNFSFILYDLLKSDFLISFFLNKIYHSDLDSKKTLTRKVCLKFIRYEKNKQTNNDFSLREWVEKIDFFHRECLKFIKNLDTLNKPYYNFIKQITISCIYSKKTSTALIEIEQIPTELFKKSLQFYDENTKNDLKRLLTLKLKKEDINLKDNIYYLISFLNPDFSTTTISDENLFHYLKYHYSYHINNKEHLSIDINNKLESLNFDSQKKLLSSIKSHLTEHHYFHFLNTIGKKNYELLIYLLAIYLETISINHLHKYNLNLFNFFWDNLVYRNENWALLHEFVKKYLFICFSSNLVMENNKYILKKENLASLYKNLNKPKIFSLISYLTHDPLALEIKSQLTTSELFDSKIFNKNYSPEDIQKVLSEFSYENIIVGQFLQENIIYNFSEKCTNNGDNILNVENVIKSLKSEKEFSVQIGGGFDDIVYADVFKESFLLEFKRSSSEFYTEIQNKNLIYGINLTHLFLSTLFLYFFQHKNIFSYSTTKKHLNSLACFLNRNVLNYSNLHTNLTLSYNMFYSDIYDSNNQLLVNTSQLIIQQRHYVITKQDEQYIYQDYFGYYLIHYDDNNITNFSQTDNAFVIEKNIKNNINSIMKPIDLFEYLSSLSHLGFFVDEKNHTFLFGAKNNNGTPLSQIFKDNIDSDSSGGRTRGILREQEQEITPSISKEVENHKQKIKKIEHPFFKN